MPRGNKQERGRITNYRIKKKPSLVTIVHYNLTITELLTYISKRQTKIFLFHLFRAHKCSRTFERNYFSFE